MPSGKREMFLYNMHISPYEQGIVIMWTRCGHANCCFIRKKSTGLLGTVMQQGLTLIPLKVYFFRGRAKVELALAKGKKIYDKRAALAEKDDRREIERAARGKE